MKDCSEIEGKKYFSTMELTDIKQKLAPVTVLHYYGLKPDKNQRLHCPFHEDKTPSMQVYHKTHTCYCFSSRYPTHGKSMDVIDFILHKENCTKAEAIQKAIVSLARLRDLRSCWCTAGRQ